MAFRFSLQAVLRLRASLEKREESRLQAILRELVHQRQQQDALARDNRVAKERLAQAMQHGIPAAELHFEAVCASARARRQEQLQKQIAELEQLRLAQQKVVERARQQREILERLRQRQLELYRQDQARRAQQQLDELFLYSRSAGRT